MGRDSGHAIRFPGHYRHDLLVWRMYQTGLTPKRLAQKSRGKHSVSADTVMQAMDGGCGTIKKLWAIAKVLELNFSELFNFDLHESEFDRAVLNVDSRPVRSSGPASVGVPQARSVERGGTYTGTRG